MWVCVFVIKIYSNLLLKDGKAFEIKEILFSAFNW